MLLVFLAIGAQAAVPSIKTTESGMMVFKASDFQFNDMNSNAALIQETKDKIQTALANDEDAQSLIARLKELNAEMAAGPVGSFNLRAFESDIAANADSASELKSTLKTSVSELKASISEVGASVDTLVTKTIAGIQDDITESENVQKSARIALENRLASKAEDLGVSIAALQAETYIYTGKADACSKAGKLYTKSGGCKEIEIPDTNLGKYTGKGCDNGNTGRLEYSSISGQMCMMLCSGGRWSPINAGRYGEQCNPAKDCAEVVTKKLFSGVYHFVSAVSNGVTTESREGYCDIVTKKMSYDGSSAKNYALHCEVLYFGYPFAGSGEFWIGESEKTAKKSKCENALYVDADGADKRVPTNSLIAWWDAADWEGGSSWPSREGKTVKPSFQGTRPSKVKGGEGAHSGYQGIKGYTRSNRINWGNIAPSTFTLCTTSKYDGGARGRIFTGYGNNWLHGHWGGNSGSSYYQGWKVNGALNQKRTQWIAWCATNGQSRSVWGNRIDMSGVKKYAGGVSTSTRWVGTGTGTHSGEASHYRIGSVIGWSRSFSESEMEKVTQYLVDRIKGKAK